MIKTLLISFLSISELIVSQEETEIFLKLKPNKNIKLVILELSDGVDLDIDILLYQSL